MEVDLSRGAVAAMSEHGEKAAGLRPVLQVADVPRLVGSPGRTAATLYRLVLSDGVHLLQGILASVRNHLVADGTLRRGTVLRLLQYICSTLQNRRIFMFIQFEVLEIDCALIGSPKLYEYGQDIPFSSILRPTQKGANNLTSPWSCGESHSAGQGTVGEDARKTVAQIDAWKLGCSDEQELVNVKATLSIINTEDFCYPACPLVVDGRQCGMKVAINGDGWWKCLRCNQTFVTCDYRYMILSKLQDSTGETYAAGSQKAGEYIFGRTAKELCLMKHEKQDDAQFANILEGVQFCEYLFKLKLNPEAFNDKKASKVLHCQC